MLQRSWYYLWWWQKKKAYWLVYCPFLQLVELYSGLFGTLKVERNGRKGVEIMSCTRSRHPTTKMVPFGKKNWLPKLDLDDEDNNLELFDPNSKMKSASLKMLTQGESIDLDSMLNVWREGPQQPSNVHFGFVLEPCGICIEKILESNLPLSKLNLLLAPRSWNISSCLRPCSDRTSSLSLGKRSWM